MLGFTLLGPVQVTVDGAPLTGIAPRHRAVLAYLLLNAGRVIGIERLIEAMWGYERPDTARSQIHASITAIRKVLRAAGAVRLLETRAGGYLVQPEPGQVDAQEFVELVAAGELRRALDLWSGEALEDVHAHYVTGVRELWNDRRLSAYERLVEGELAVHVAHRLAARYPDGRLFIDLRAHTAGREPLDAAAALEALLRQLGVPAGRIPVTLAERSALWRAELADRRVLAMLDNALDAEHVRPLLPGHSDTLALITSRRRLVDLDGAQALSVDVLDEADAAELFQRIVGERARDEPEAVHEVLRLCGRLPLALRICTARLQHRPRWTVSYLAGRLRDHRRLLDGVSAAFALSYAQLHEAEQRTFRLLGLVPGRDIDACGAAALAGISEDEAEELLEGLLDAHMLLQLEPGRYTFHDLLREHARSLAEDDGALMRLLGYYLHRSRAAMDRLFPHTVSQREGIPQPAAPIAPVRGRRRGDRLARRRALQHHRDGRPRARDLSRHAGPGDAPLPRPAGAPRRRAHTAQPGAPAQPDARRPRGRGAGAHRPGVDLLAARRVRAGAGACPPGPRHV
ncbi:winged helix-turn-helix domain-containing protein [Microbispora sp. NPDC088329]|uniref:AfsR/SARP family transcriptional regulator n=1 Tax=Microbispora sp. NPDC088329 TaxID=3154869 RepID=UPI00342B3B70